MEYNWRSGQSVNCLQRQLGNDNVGGCDFEDITAFEFF